MQKQHSNNVENNKMTQNYKFKRMKQLFLVFLKQFNVDDYKLLIHFLHLIINNYNSNPTKLFGFLTNLSDYSIEKELKDQNSEQINSFKYKPTISYYLKRKRNLLIRENKFKLREFKFLNNIKTKLINDDIQFYDNDNNNTYVNNLKDTVLKDMNITII